MKDSNPGYQWGDSGEIHTFKLGDKNSRLAAFAKAMADADKGNQEFKVAKFYDGEQFGFWMG
jgi:hypothetical protein